MYKGKRRDLNNPCNLHVEINQRKKNDLPNDKVARFIDLSQNKLVKNVLVESRCSTMAKKKEITRRRKRIDISSKIYLNYIHLKAFHK